MKTILTPLDGSALSESALPYTETIARAAGARVVLTRVALARGLSSWDIAEGQLQAVQEAEAYLSVVADRLAKRGLVVETAVPYGDAAEMIASEVGIHRADLVIMATHGRSGLGRLLFGSVAQQVLCTVTVPLLLIPRGCQRFLSTERPPRILVPLDGSDRSDQILAPAADLARTLRARLILLEVASVVSPAIDSQEARERLLLLERSEPGHTRDKAENHLARVADQLRAAGLDVEYHAVTGEPVSTIAAEASTQAVDLIAMATHGRTGLARLVMGSVTEATLRRVDLPMLVLRPSGLETKPASASGASGAHAPSGG